MEILKKKLCNEYRWINLFPSKNVIWHVYCLNKPQQFITWLNFKMINHLTVKKGGGE